MGRAAAEGIDKDLANGFLLSLEVDPEASQNAKSLDFGYLGSGAVAAAVSPRRSRRTGKRVKGIQCGALHRLHAAARKLASSHTYEAKQTAAPAALPTAPDNSTRKFAAETDQADEGVFKLFSPIAVVELRQIHVKVTGDDPLPAARPTADQFASFRSKVSAGRSPYVDIAFFGPYGDRITRTLRFQSEVFVGSELVKKQLKGLATFQCSAVFKAACIMLGVAGPATLDR